MRISHPTITVIHIHIWNCSPPLPPQKHLELSHYFKVVVLSLLFINSVTDGKCHDLMLSVFLPLLSAFSFLVPYPLVVWKSFKKERRHAERTWRYNCQAFHNASFFFLTPIPDVWLAACSTACLYVFDCLVTVCAQWPACTKYVHFLIWHCCLSVLLSLSPSADAGIGIAPFLSSSPFAVTSFVYIPLSSFSSSSTCSLSIAPVGSL